MHFSFRDCAAGLIGNLLEHYDTALFGLLAPFIAPLFFENLEPITALILTYCMLPLGLLVRPLGSICFGRIGDSFGRKRALIYSLMGMAVVTIGMGCLPVYKDIGLFAPILLACGRLLQSFCAAGELAGGAIFVLEHTTKARRGFSSSLYDASSIGGILIASGLVTYISSQGNTQHDWRILFWAGGFTAVLGIFLRLFCKEGFEFTQAAKQPSVSLIQILKQNKHAIISIILASGFSYTTYSLAFTLMNGYIPLITNLSKTQVLQMNTLLLCADLLLLPCFGYIAYKFGKERIMMGGALGSAIAAVPLFYLLEDASLSSVLIVRLLIVIFGVAFAAPYHAWAIEQVPPQHRYLVLSLGCALGSLLIGTPTSPLCLWLYHTLGLSYAPGLYLMIVGLAASLTVYHRLAPKPKPLTA